MSGTEEVKTVYTSDVADLLTGMAKAGKSEQDLAAEILKSKAALDARAKALGVSVGDLGKIDGALKSAAKAEKAEAEAVRASTEAHKDAAKAADKLGDSFGKVGSSSAKSAGLLSAVDPAAGDAARGLNDLADVGEVFAEVAAAAGVSTSALLLTLGPVAVAAGLLYGAYYALNGELDRANAKVDAQTEIANRWVTVTGQWKPTLADINREWDVATGAMTANQAAAEKQTDAWKTSREATAALMQTTIANATVERDAAAASLGTAQAYVKKHAEMADANDSVMVTYRQQIEQLSAVESAAALTISSTTSELAAFTRATQEGADKVRILADQRDKEAALAAKATKLAKEEADAKARHTAAAAKLKTELADLSTALNANATDAAKNAAAFETAEEKLRGLGEKASAAILTGTAKEAADFKARIAEADALRLEQLARVGDNASAKETIEADYQRAVRQMNAATAAEIVKIQTKENADAKKAADAAAKIAKDLAQKKVDAEVAAGSSILDSGSKLANALNDGSKKGALAAFEVQQAVALANLAVTGPSAVVKGLAEGGPIGGIAAGAAVAVEAVEIATAKPPSFKDTPGVQKMKRKGLIELDDDDYFVAAKDPRELARQAGSGRAASVDPLGGGGQTSGGAVTYVDHRAVHRTLRGSLQRHGPLAAAIAGEASVGRRIRSTGA